ncbi:catalase [Enterobacterales bacterium CwR94]|nr:catalase [Enterobacterales bacterium CwR94]
MPRLTSLFLLLIPVVAVPLLLLLFLWSGGWLAQDRLSADTLVNTLEQSAGEHPGFRRNHAKGVCVFGDFTASGAAASLSRATLFQQGVKTPVVGRFALAGGNPNAPDYGVPVRSLALALTLPNGQQWRTGMNALPFFPVATPAGFYDQQIATRPDPTTGKPNPQHVAAFIARHPEAKAFFAWAKTFTPTNSWTNARYNSLNAFRFIDTGGNVTPVRWSLIPQAAAMPMSAADRQDPLFLQHDLEKRLQQGPQQWQLQITVAGPQDNPRDASIAWPASRQTVNAGTLTLTHASPQEKAACNDINYDPLILPEGIAASDDPLLNARSATYAKSYNRRTVEQAHLEAQP